MVAALPALAFGCGGGGGANVPGYSWSMRSLLDGWIRMNLNVKDL